MLDTLSGGAAACGISSFAFQGTNAHALLGACEEPEASHVMEAQRMNWSKQSLWLAPRAHPLLGTFQSGPGTGKAAVESAVGGAALSYLWDHRVNGRALLPGTGFM